MLLQLSPEHRSIAKQKNMITEVPSGTPAHIVARLVAGIVALCEKRSITAAEERSYQSAAARYVRPQSDIQSQIAAWNQRQAAKRKTVTDVRSLAAQYPAVSLEDIAVRARIYSGTMLEDALLQLRSAAIGRQIRQGGAFGVGAPSPRYQGGQAEDPQQSLRNSVTFHRNCASKAKSMNECVAHHKAADEAERKLKG
jgi:hypothetical protein